MTHSSYFVKIFVKHTTKKDTAEGEGEKEEEEKDAHRLVVDKKEGEQSHGKRGSGGGR